MLPQFLLLAATSVAADTLLGFPAVPVIENRTIDDIYKAALAEGGIVTVWAGGDEITQQNPLKTAFEERFPGMVLNVTVDLSKYHDTRLDEQFASNAVYVDNVFLQTLHDFPRWSQEGYLLNYAPVGFDKIHPAIKSTDASWYALFFINWAIQWNSSKLPGVTISEYPDLLQPELKDKLVLTYPNDDDAVLYQFDLIMKQYGESWFESLLAQNPRWVRGTQTPSTILGQTNSTQAVTFTSSGSPTSAGPINVTFPVEGQFVLWPQTGAILKDAPHPEGAKLLFNFMLSEESQKSAAWSVRQDIPISASNPYGSVWNMSGTNPTSFGKWMQNRANVERLRFYFETRLGTAQGLSPLVDDI